MKDSDGSKRPWRPTVDRYQHVRSAPTLHATPSQTATVIANATGVNSARGPTETPAIARHQAPSEAMVAPISSLRARIASASPIRCMDCGRLPCHGN